MLCTQKLSNTPFFVVSSDKLGASLEPLPWPSVTGVTLFPHVDHMLAREAGVFLRFIVDHYDCLPRVVGFIHGHASSWHQPVRAPTHIYAPTQEIWMDFGWMLAAATQNTKLALRQALRAAKQFERANCTEFFISLFHNQKQDAKARAQDNIAANKRLAHFWEEWFPEGQARAPIELFPLL